MYFYCDTANLNTIGFGTLVPAEPGVNSFNNAVNAQWNVDLTLVATRRQIIPVTVTTTGGAFTGFMLVHVVKTVT